MTRGYAIVALDNPKHGVNIGSALRASACYGAAALVMSGNRIPKDWKKADTTRNYRHMPTYKVVDVFDQLRQAKDEIGMEVKNVSIPTQREIEMFWY